jgi:hypothetical protein
MRFYEYLLKMIDHHSSIIIRIKLYTVITNAKIANKNNKNKNTNGL